MAAERKTKPAAKYEIATEVTENAAAFFAFEIGFGWLCFLGFAGGNFFIILCRKERYIRFGFTEIGFALQK